MLTTFYSSRISLLPSELELVEPTARTALNFNKDDVLLIQVRC